MQLSFLIENCELTVNDAFDAEHIHKNPISTFESGSTNQSRNKTGDGRRHSKEHNAMNDGEVYLVQYKSRDGHTVVAIMRTSKEGHKLAGELGSVLSIIRDRANFWYKYNSVIV